MNHFKTPKPPYYAVIFTSERTEGDRGYSQMADEMLDLVSKQKGFLGVESVRDQNGMGITVSYWDSLDSIQNWKENVRHQVAQEKGKAEWYKRFSIRICKVERETFFMGDNEYK
jgi:heme-degrading monooxygenase HmoA